MQSNKGTCSSCGAVGVEVTDEGTQSRCWAGCSKSAQRPPSALNDVPAVWRTGRKNPHTVYLDDEYAGTGISPTWAARLVSDANVGVRTRIGWAASAPFGSDGPGSDIGTPVLVRATLRMLEDGDAYVELETGEHVKVQREHVQRMGQGRVSVDGHEVSALRTVAERARVIDLVWEDGRPAIRGSFDLMKAIDHLDRVAPRVVTVEPHTGGPSPTGQELDSSRKLSSTVDAERFDALGGKTVKERVAQIRAEQGDGKVSEDELRIAAWALTANPLPPIVPGEMPIRRILERWFPGAPEHTTKAASELAQLIGPEPRMADAKVEIETAKYVSLDEALGVVKDWTETLGCTAPEDYNNQLACVAANLATMLRNERARGQREGADATPDAANGEAAKLRRELRKQADCQARKRAVWKDDLGQALARARGLEKQLAAARAETIEEAAICAEKQAGTNDMNWPRNIAASIRALSPHAPTQDGGTQK